MLMIMDYCYLRNFSKKKEFKKDRERSSIQLTKESTAWLSVMNETKETNAWSRVLFFLTFLSICQNVIVLCVMSSGYNVDMTKGVFLKLGRKK